MEFTTKKSLSPGIRNLGKSGVDLLTGKAGSLEIFGFADATVALVAQQFEFVWAARGRHCRN